MRRALSVFLVTILTLQALLPAAAGAVSPSDQSDPVETPAARRQREREAQKQQEAGAEQAHRDSLYPGDMAPLDTLSDEYIRCKDMGRSTAKEMKTGGSFAGGMAGGVLLGLIGTGIAVLVQGKPEPSAVSMMQLPANNCRQAFADAYGSQGRSKKRKSALLGGLVGTAVAVVIIYSLSSQ